MLSRETISGVSLIFAGIFIHVFIASDIVSILIALYELIFGNGIMPHFFRYIAYVQAYSGIAMIVSFRLFQLIERESLS